MILSGSTPVSITLVTDTEAILESQIVHTAATLTLAINFGTQGQLCRKMVQDITIYYYKC